MMPLAPLVIGFYSLYVGISWVIGGYILIAGFARLGSLLSMVN